MYVKPQAGRVLLVSQTDGSLSGALKPSRWEVENWGLGRMALSLPSSCLQSSVNLGLKGRLCGDFLSSTLSCLCVVRVN